MGRDNTVPTAFGRVHPVRQTPVFATGVVAVVSLVLFVVSNYLGTVADVLEAAISALGLQIAFYYGLAALAVVLAYRRVLFRSVSNLIFIGLWPLLGAVFMFWVFIESLPELDTTTKAVGLGALALGLIPLGWYWAKGVAYYRQKPLETFTDLEAASPVPPSAREAVDSPEPV
jgi:amino acid transporter